MKILLASPEIAPVTKVGGIADGIAGLAKWLRRFGLEVVVVSPRFRAAERVAIDTTPAPPITLEDGQSLVSVGVANATLDTDVRLTLLEIPGVPEALGPYGHDVGDDQNARRFGLFARAAVEFACREAARGAPFDIVHAHEWPAAMVLYLLRGRLAEAGSPSLVLGVHTLAYQGIFPPSSLAHFGLGLDHYRPDRLEFYGRVNLMKGGILAADRIVAVSTTYAKEIQEPDRGELLDGVLRARANDLVGIVNGIDTEIWDPRRDPALPASYGPDDLAGKALCKRALSKEVGLADEPHRPLVVSVGRVFDQKGSDLLIDAIPSIIAEGASIAVAGAGDPALERALHAAVAKHPLRAAYVGFASEELVHRILAAGDVFVMPSRFEPCGIVQLYAQRYGTLPVARRTGGLVDTIADASPDLSVGTGILFDDVSGEALAAAVQRALGALGEPGYPALQARMMRLDVGWGRAARRYAELYRALRRSSR